MPRTHATSHAFLMSRGMRAIALYTRADRKRENNDGARARGSRECKLIAPAETIYTYPEINFATARRGLALRDSRKLMRSNTSSRVAQKKRKKENVRHCVSPWEYKNATIRMTNREETAYRMLYARRTTRPYGTLLLSPSLPLNDVAWRV